MADSPSGTGAGERDTAASGSSRKIDCVACKEPIRPGASLCPHCGTSQHPSPWSSVSNALKWVGGIVTVISLVLGVRTLIEHYGRWQEERAAIEELVSAAEWLAEAGNHRQAWSVLEDASQLSPSASEVRAAQADLAKAWLRMFWASREEAPAILDSLTEILYRQLAHASPDESATVLAHVARAEMLRISSGVAPLVDPTKLLDEALEASPENGYANAYKAHWLVVERPVKPEAVAAAIPFYARALEADLDRVWLRKLQMNTLANLSENASDETELAASRAFLVAARDMMEAGEPRPHSNARRDVLEGFGFMGRADGVEPRLDVLPPEEYRRVLDWLRDGMEWTPSHRAQQRYIDARLAELAGREEEALASIRELMEADGASDRLQTKLDQDVLRLTGSLPARALARKYLDDPVDEADPFSFHLDTLRHFDPKWLSDNRTQALDFFAQAAKERHPRLPELIAAMPAILERVKEVRLEGDELTKFNAFMSGYSAGHYQSVRQNTGELLYVWSMALRATDDLDAAIAVAGDFEAFVADFDDHFDAYRAAAAWELAVGHALRAARDGTAEDRSQALAHLEAAISRRAFDYEIGSWEAVKGDLFAGVANEPAYQDLVRGR